MQALTFMSCAPINCAHPDSQCAIWRDRHELPMLEVAVYSYGHAMDLSGYAPSWQMNPSDCMAYSRLEEAIRKDRRAIRRDSSR